MQSWSSAPVPAVPGRGPELRLYDTSDRQVRPVTSGRTATMYVCGITPYDATHLGHAATYLSFDLIHNHPGLPVLLLLLLLLLARIQRPTLGERNRLTQHLDVADMIGEDQDQRGVEIGALFLGEAAMRFDDGAERIVRLCEVGAGGERHDRPLQFKAQARATAASSAGRVG